MKRVFLFILTTLLSVNIWCQDITGSWYGQISLMGHELRLNFHISREAGQYSATMDSPDQKAFGIPMQSVSYQDSILSLKVSNITYTASLDSATNLKGIFKQGGIKTDLYMTHQELTEAVIKEVLRPQEPIPPFPYHAEDVRFKGAGDYELAGTILIPQKGKDHPIAVFISGSGAQNRDEELLKHKPFLVIADYLARKGIASLRYDDRGTAESGGRQNQGTSLDNALDAAAAVDFLKELGHTNIGLIGHSEGSLIASIVASKDSSIAFIVSLAGPGVSGAEIVKKQSLEIAKAEDISEEVVQAQQILNAYLFDRIALLKQYNTDSILYIIEKGLQQLNPEQLDATLSGMSKDEYIQTSIQQMSNEWLFHFLRFDPKDTWKKVRCPVLAVNGAKDLQVDADINLANITQALKEGQNPKVKTIKYPELNHLFQHALTGSPSEYAKIEESFSPEVLKDMTDFIRKSTGVHQKMVRYIDGGVAALLLILLFFVLKKTVKGQK